MKRLSNPFPYGRELRADELVNRDAERETILRSLENRDKLFLIGPRRFGKTSLLATVEQEAWERGISVLRFDAEKYETLELLAQAIVTGAARAMQGGFERMSELVRTAAAALRPTFQMDEHGSVSVQFGVDTGRKGELPLLGDALDSVETLAERSGQQVAVVLDEVQQIVVDHGLVAERQLRATVQRHRSVAYVFAGSATRLLSEMTGHPDRPFYRLGSRLFLGEIPRGEFLEALVAGFDQSGFGVEPGACERILDLAEEVPYNVQRLAHQSWEMVRVAPDSPLSKELVARALESIVRMEDTAYTQLWISLTRNQKKTLKAVIEAEGENLQSSTISRQFKIPVSSIQRSLADLEVKQILRVDHAGGTVRYRLVDPFLGGWIRVVQAF